jgi:hypothetical protein
MTMRALLALALVVGAVGGCIDTDAAVFVEVAIGAPSLSVQQSSLVTALSGSFEVLLHLGPRASGPSQVKLVSFAVTDSSGNDVVAPLAGEASPPFPVSVDVDSDVTVAVAVNGQELAADAVTDLCAGPVTIVATLDDSLRGAIVAGSSAPVVPAGCP